MPNPSKFCIYNSNNPKKFAIIKMNGLTFRTTEFNLAKDACGVGPFLGFFIDEPQKTYRLHGPFCGRNDTRFYAVGNTGLCYDNIQESIVNWILFMLNKDENKDEKKKEKICDVSGMNQKHDESAFVPGQPYYRLD